MEPFINQFSPIVSSYVPTLLGALGILILGWIVAHVSASATRGLVHKTTVDSRLAGVFFPHEPLRRKTSKIG